MKLQSLPAKFFVFSLFFGAILFFAPSSALACHQTHIDSPEDGSSLHFDSLPARVLVTVDRALGELYSLELYEGVPGNSRIIAGGFYNQFFCNDNNTDPNPFRIDRAGDYFFVFARVYDIENVSNFQAWHNYWENGAEFLIDRVDHDISRFSVNKEITPDPVIIIPGILGSWDKDGVWVIDPVLHTYDDLIDTLAANGYAKGEDLFTMPYDWRQSNILSALQLRDRINEVQAICNCEKVDLVAHSMGGLIARQYVQSDKYENDVDQLIFLGTPHLGAPKAYLMWEGGEMDTGLSDQTTKFVLSREAKKEKFDNLFDYVRNKPIPSIQELLPIYDYLRDKSSGELKVYPNNYPQNIFLENLKNSIDSLLNSGIRITNIIGELENSTINTIRVVESPTLPLWEHGYPEQLDEKVGDQGLERSIGDGTVPINSSGVLEYDLNKIVAIHRKLPNEAEGLIFKKLTGEDALILIDNVNFPSIKLLIIKILSPVDVLVTAPDGKKIGKNFETNEEINEIEGAFYSGFLTDNEYITIPDPLDGEYTIETGGTGDGEYTIATGYISDAVLTENDFTAQTIIDLHTELHLEINNSSPEELRIEPEDKNPPAIIIHSPEDTDYLRSDVLPITINIHDEESGLFFSQITFDDRIINENTAVDLFFEKLGNHTIKVDASDFVGNTASTTKEFRIIATPESVIADIQRAFALGWIIDKRKKDNLIKDFEKIIRLEKRIETLEEKLPGGAKITKRIERIEKRIDKILGRLLLKKLEQFYNKGYINEQAYNVLKEDVGWLLNN